ncbi:MAG: ABC transporter ATP-binding protein [Verrucomicrobiales bacterium]
MSQPVLQIDNLSAGFEVEGDLLTAVDGVSFEVAAGHTLGVVGESGCGKSVTAFSVMRLLPQPMGKILGGQIVYGDRDLALLTNDEMAKVRGTEIGMIFQEPMTALNPVHRFGRQLMEAVLLHQKPLGKDGAYNLCIEMLDKVGIPSPDIRFGEYPHQLSGGMRQRVMIAMALINKPKVLIADEPTTALDVTVQAQILNLMKDLQKEMGMAIILITHDLGVIAETCDEVVVMYAGRVVERGPIREIFANPQHAYTKGLLASIPRLDTPPKSVLPIIPGMVPALKEMPSGCRFGDRSGKEHTEEELKTRPPLKKIGEHHWVEACPKCYQP